MSWNSIVAWLRERQDIVALATFGSLILAWIQIFMARRQTKSLAQIEESLTTRHLGDLSSYYPQIISLIEAAKESIVILCDYPAYGCFTNSKHWRNYYIKLLSKRAEGKVSMSFICPKKSLRVETDETEYFTEADENWTNWKRDITNRERLKAFLLKTPDKKQMDINRSNVETIINNLSRRSFLEMLQLADKWILQNCFEEADIKFINSKPPLDLFIVDGTTAIFALINYDEGMSRYGFWTKDQRLIYALHKTKDLYIHALESPSSNNSFNQSGD